MYCKRSFFLAHLTNFEDFFSCWREFIFYAYHFGLVPRKERNWLLLLKKNIFCWKEKSSNKIKAIFNSERNTFIWIGEFFIIFNTCSLDRILNLNLYKNKMKNEKEVNSFLGNYYFSSSVWTLAAIFYMSHFFLT